VRSILLIVIALIVYGSLYPFDFRLSHEYSIGALTISAFNPFTTTRGDILGNIALCAPLGFFGMYAMHGVGKRATQLFIVILSGAAFAWLLQWGQLFVPERDPTLVDVFWNVIGVVMGSAIACSPLGRRLPSSIDGSITFEVPFVLAGLWVASQLMPLVPSLDLQLVKDNLKTLLQTSKFQWGVSFLELVSWLAVFQFLGSSRLSKKWNTLLPALPFVVMGAQLFIVRNELTLEEAIGAMGGLVIWLAVRTGLRPGWLAALLLIGILAANLSSLDLGVARSSFSWVPFSDFLGGDMVLNVASLMRKTFLYGTLVWLLKDAGMSWAAATGLVASTLTIEELLRVYVAGASAGVTDPFLAVLTATAMYKATRRLQYRASEQPMLLDEVQNGMPRDVQSARSVNQVPSVGHFGSLDGLRGLAAPNQWSLYTAIIALVASIAIITIGIKIILRFPGVPYNVKELFLDGASIPVLAIFSLALLWVGGGAMILAHWLVASRRSYLILPGGALLLSIVSRTFLKYSVTYESLNDILGSSNLFQNVTRNNIWGDFWSDAFLAANMPNLVEFFERLIRYAALYSLLAVTLAAVLVPVVIARQHRKLNMWPLLAMATTASVWLWLSKMVVIDGANTDNLTELVAQHSLLGLGGVPFLFLLVALMATNVALLLVPRDSLWIWATVLICLVITVPAGWWLLNAGLEKHIQKYGLVFSGVQFLLGSDREHSLNEHMLFLRWAAVQTGAVGVMFIGAWIADRLALAKRYRQVFVIAVIAMVLAEAAWRTYADILGHL